MQGGSFGSKSNGLQLIPESNFIKELSLEDASEIVDTLNSIKNGTNSAYKSIDEYLTYLGTKGKGYVKNYVKENQNQVFISDDVVDASKQARQAQLDHNAAIQASTLSAKAGQIALKGLALAGNMLAGMAISWVITKIVEGLDDVVHASENAREAMNDAFSEYKSAKSEVESLNSELETTQKRIDELNAKQNLSLVEKGELDTLQQTNKELETKISLLEKEVALKQKDSAVAAIESVETTFGTDGISEDDINFKLRNYEANVATGNVHPETFLLDKNDLEDNITALKIYNDLLDEAYTQKDQDNIESYTDTLGELKDTISENLLILYEQKDSMEDYYNYISKQDASTLTSSEIEMDYTADAVFTVSASKSGSSTGSAITTSVTSIIEITFG